MFCVGLSFETAQHARTARRRLERGFVPTLLTARYTHGASSTYDACPQVIHSLANIMWG
jgi:hypothetical protein